MNNMFVKGDLVECIDASTSGSRLCEGIVYLVTGVRGNYLDLVDLVTDSAYEGWNYQRFVKHLPEPTEKEETFVEGDTVVCVDNDGTLGQLTKGKLYTIIMSGGQLGKVIVVNDEGKKITFFAKRFRKVADTNAGMPTEKSRPQVGGTHYQVGIEPADYIFENGLDFFEGNVIKYITRHRKKNGKEDLLKAKQYIDILIEKEYPNV